MPTSSFLIWVSLRTEGKECKLSTPWMGSCTGLEQLGESATPYTKLSFHTPQPLVYCLGELLLLRMSPNLSLKKATNTLLRLFVGQRSKITFLLVQQAQRLGDFASNAVLVIRGQQSER